MSGEDKRYLNGTRLSEVWAKVKSHVTTTLQGWDGRNTTASGTHTSNITHVGTIAYGVWQGTAIGASYLPVADGTSGSEAAGIVSTAAQSFAGLKTFSNGVNVPKGSVYYNLDDKAVLQLNTSNYTVFNYGMRAVSGNRVKFYAQDRYEWYLGDTKYMEVTSARLAPQTNDSLFLGNSSIRWKNIYSILGNFSGKLTASAGIDCGGYIDISNGNNFAGLRHITTSYGSSNIGGVDSGGVYFAHTLTGAATLEMRLKAGVGLSINSHIKTSAGGNVQASGGVSADGIADLALPYDMEMPIVYPSGEPGATPYPISSLNVEVGKFYYFTAVMSNTNTDIYLPNITDTTKMQYLKIKIWTGSGADVVFHAAQTIKATSAIARSTNYLLTCIHAGNGWLINCETFPTTISN